MRDDFKTLYSLVLNFKASLWYVKSLGLIDVIPPTGLMSGMCLRLNDK